MELPKLPPEFLEACSQSWGAAGWGPPKEPCCPRPSRTFQALPEGCWRVLRRGEEICLNELIRVVVSSLRIRTFSSDETERDEVSGRTMLKGAAAQSDMLRRRIVMVG